MELTVKDVMTLNVKSLRLNEQLSLADDVMTLDRIRHLPVLDQDGEKLVGIVSQRDLFRGALAQAVGYTHRARRKLLDKLRIKDIMTADVITTTPETPLSGGGADADGAQNRMPAGGQGSSPRRHSHRDRFRGALSKPAVGIARAALMIRKS
jgi:hypothetical protein